MFDYKYNISETFNGQFDTQQFDDWIRTNSTIEPLFLGVSTINDIISVYFSRELTQGEIEILETLIANYQYNPVETYEEPFKHIIKCGRTSSSSWTSVGAFIYSGTGASGFCGNLHQINGTSRVLGSTNNYQWRILDADNNKVIGTTTVCNNTTRQIIPLGDLSNIPSGKTIMNVQAIRIGGSDANEIDVESIEILYL
jgi:hypothetical protein